MEDEDTSSRNSWSSSSDEDHRDQTPVRNDAIGRARTAFHCGARQLSHFKNKEDPFNCANTLDGLICRREGKFGGSILLTVVNGRPVQEQKIWGTPKLDYPYTNSGYDTGVYKDFGLKLKGKCAKYVLANKWNGTNVLFYKYKDYNGKTFISAKSKGSAFIGNTNFGSFLTLTYQVLDLDVTKTKSLTLDNLPDKLVQLKDPNIQSVCFELCGRKEPHLVKYDFGADLKPLFVTYYDGSIAPCSNPEDLGPFPFDGDEMVKLCKQKQREDLERNIEFRKANNLHLRYEHDHFACEGRVLYLLDADGKLLRRTMYKIKPHDIEEVHWGNFTETMQGRVREAIEKIVLRHKPLNEMSIREELDMKDKEWSKYGKDVMALAKKLQDEGFTKDHRTLVIVAGYPGSGREEFINKLKSTDWQVVGGPVDSCIGAIRQKMSKNNMKIIVDTPNLSVEERKQWIEEAFAEDVKRIEGVLFDVAATDCMKKWKKLGKEETEELKQIWNKPLIDLQVREGFINVSRCQKEADWRKVVSRVNFV